MLFLATNVIEQAFSPLISLFEGVMVFLHGVLGSWGMAIVGLTVIVRAVMVPLTFRSLKSMQEMQRHAPEINALKEKYKDDKQRQQQEVMKYYQEMGINPLASCLPLVLQLPVFISLFYMLRSDLKLDICGEALRKHFHVATNSQIPAKGLAETGCNQVAPGSAKFLFIPDITAKATGVVLVTLILLYVGSQIASTLVATATADPTQRRIALVLPIVFVVILYRYPAGLLVYWITSNTWTIGQQYLVRRHMAAHPADGASRGSGGSGGGGGSPNGKPDAPRAGPAKEPALAGVGSSSPASAPSASPPRPPRKKKKRSGRRR
jgi:YidC/Oxa1 family membrane protein insertase